MKLIGQTALWSEIRSRNDRSWRVQQDELQTQLANFALADALLYLYTFHEENGFIEDDLSETRYFCCPCTQEKNWSRRFILQFNPRRARRVATGRTGRCVFDAEDFRRQQRGLQHFYQLTLNGRAYNAFPNPFPFAQLHTSIASAKHESQTWNDPDPQIQNGRIRRIVEDLYDLATIMPGWCAGYNGMGAGATVDHLHFHIFQLPESLGPSPIQVAAKRKEAPSAQRFGSDDNYPLTVFRVTGSKEIVMEVATNVLANWTTIGHQDATANLVSLTENGEPCLYITPRIKLLEFAPGFGSRLGIMEVMGLFIMSRESDLNDLLNGQITYEGLWTILRAIEAPGAVLLNVL